MKPPTILSTAVAAAFATDLLSRVALNIPLLYGEDWGLHMTARLLFLVVYSGFIFNKFIDEI